jgi:Domain of unknown function (DUF4335)
MQRQYMLPNCTLSLEGLSDMSGSGKITILTNAECRFSNIEETLSGGKDFFSSLVKAVSDYAQQFLSGVPHPTSDEHTDAIVHLQQLEPDYLHRLTVQIKETADSQPIIKTIDLTTVHLFDLVEAIDQFLSDGNTLPDLMIDITPVSQRYALGREPIVKRATPPALGIGSIIVVAIATYLLPVPKVEKPKELSPQPQTNSTTDPQNKSNTDNQKDTNSVANNTPTENPKPKPPLNPTQTAEIESAINSAQTITNPNQLRFLERKLQRKIDRSLGEKIIKSDDKLVYRINVGKDGAILNYKPIDNLATNKVQETPLPDLVYVPTPGTNLKLEAIADFKVVFTKLGAVQISPWEGYRAKPDLGKRIGDRQTLTDLNSKLASEIKSKITANATFKKPLIYRVAVNKNGAIIDYEPSNNAAFDYEKETPLPVLLPEEKSTIPDTEEPLAHFKVTFQQDGKLMIDNWK